MNVKQTVSPKTSLKTKRRLIVLGGVAAVGIVAIVFFSINYFGVQHDSFGQKTTSSPYPFLLTDQALQKVNFTVLAPQINSPFAEVRPYITQNGKELFFCRRNHPDNAGKQKDIQDIWASTLKPDGKWGAPQNLGLVVNSKYADAICSVSPDGSEIIFIRDKMDPSKLLMKSTRSANGWSEPEAMEIENYYNNDGYVDFFYSYQAKVLLMAVQRDDSKGGQDLYVSFPKGKNKWSEPVSLGTVVNSVESDFAPFLSADGKTLYFSSYGHGGLGGSDIFETTRLDDSWKHWSKPQNMGEGINSTREESYFSISSDNHIYFESYVKDGLRDIFRADLPKHSEAEVFHSDPVVATNKR